MRKKKIYEYVLKSWEERRHAPDFEGGITATEVANALQIWRNDASVELNRLVAEGKLNRQGKKNILFFPAAPASEAEAEPVQEQETAGPAADAESGHLKPVHTGDMESAAFRQLVGANGSLKHQIRVAKAAVTYPPHGLNLLITGPTGSGKTRFAQAIWEYAKEREVFQAGENVPFVHFNCAEYTDNPQLLLSNLFGYKKGAFTGAASDKAGLVEEADGGILLLDEIHCLSSTSQELFFTLLDTGFYRRVGDSQKREAHFMLIGATTKPVTDVLLDTFIRRMPVLVQIPALADRPVSERCDFIKYFYQEEAIRIGRTVRVRRDVLNALLDNTLHTSQGLLKNAIQISCAKAFLRANSDVNRQKEVEVTFADISFQAFSRDMAYAQSPLFAASKFRDDLVIYPTSSQKNSRREEPSRIMDIYELIENNVDVTQQSVYNLDAAQQIIAKEITTYYGNLNNILKESENDIGPFNNIVFHGAMQISAEFIAMAARDLDRKYPTTAPMLLAMHLSQYVDRRRSEQPAFPVNLSYYARGYVKEADFLHKNSEWLGNALKVSISEDELDFLTIFLNQFPESDTCSAPAVWITIVSCHAGTASSMGAFADSVFHYGHIHWLDRTQKNSMNNVFHQVCENVSSYHGTVGNLILTDIKMLSGLEQEICRASGVACRVIPILEHHLLMDACKTIMAADDSLDRVYDQVIRNYHAFIQKFFESAKLKDMAQSCALSSQKERKVVITVCITGVGSAQKIRDILEDKLSFIPGLQIVMLSSLQDIPALAKEYGEDLKIIIGTINPGVANVPFVSADRVFTANGMYCIASILDDWNYSMYDTDMGSDFAVGDDLDRLLTENFRSIAPNVNKEQAVPCIYRLIRSLETRVYGKPIEENLCSRIFFHAASMLQRISEERTLQLEEEHEELIRENQEWFDFLSRMLQNIFQPTAFDIPRSECFYFMLSLPEAEKQVM